MKDLPATPPDAQTARILANIEAAAADRPPGAVALLCTTAEIRRRAQALLARAREGRSAFFTVDDKALEAAADAVVRATRSRYPHGAIPFHSRWRHFEVGGVDRRARLDELLGPVAPAVCARAQIDLTLVSVLLDAGAGPGWHYEEAASGRRFGRSEGLAVASFHAFTAGMFSSRADAPLQVDAQGLRGVITERLAQAFQATPANPLLGLEGRATLLRRLGETLAEHPSEYGSEGRPGRLLDLLANTDDDEIPSTAEVNAHGILSTLLLTLNGIWPAGNAIGGLPVGDCWPLQEARGPGLSDGWMPFHKLSQWLTYSLLEPFQWAGVKVHGIDALTGLPEYRNGGLLIDSGVLRLRENTAGRRWKAGDPCIVEWRALTVALLDALAPLVRARLGLSAEAMPLACVLEGGTWAAGREYAQHLRGGLPPLEIESDGTVF